jgi:hypothetical protein
MPLYEIVLVKEAADEVRLDSEPPPVGAPFELAGRVWTAGAPEPAQRAGAVARYVCVEAVAESARLRERAHARVRRTV